MLTIFFCLLELIVYMRTYHVTLPIERVWTVLWRQGYIYGWYGGSSVDIFGHTVFSAIELAHDAPGELIAHLPIEADTGNELLNIENVKVGTMDGVGVSVHNT